MFVLFTQLGTTASKAITAGMVAYKTSPTVSTCSAAAAGAARDWNPAIKGKALLTPALRAKLADALGHLAYNMAAADSGGTLQ